MAFYYKIEKPWLPLHGIHVYETNATEALNNQSGTYDFSKHVLIELLDDVTPEAKLWAELGLASNKNLLHKRMMVDSHRVHCRRAIVVCASASDAKRLAQRVSQTKVMKRCVCATVVQDLLFDFRLFEKQILRLGDKRPQHQLLYVTDLNRCREPAVLAQFLRELFSPFGTVLSVFVSDDEDGFAHPEGVVKFAHLSEAFAAEIAYDQYILGMERLSVTTHHNILLSQCDLRVRLREAQNRHSDTLNNTLTTDNHFFAIPEVDSPKSTTMENRLQSTENAGQRLFNETTEYQMDINNSPPPFSDGNISHSTELEDVLKNPCKSNLIDCLKSMALCSNSSATRETITDSLSFSSQTDCDKTQSSKSHKASYNITEPSIMTLPLKEQNWTSRISNWIADIPNDFSLSNNIHNSITNTNDTVSLGNKVLNCKTMDCASSICSFVTCTNGTQNLVENPLSSPSSHKSHSNVSETNSLSDGNETILRVSSSPGSYHTTKNSVDMSMCTTDMSLTRIQSQCSVSTSMSQIGNSSCSQKLSLKNQKMCSSLPSNSQQSLDSASKKLKFPVVRLKRLSPEEIQNLCSPTSTNDTLRPSKYQRSSSDIPEPSVSSDKENNPSVSGASRRSSRRSSCQSSLYQS